MQTIKEAKKFLQSKMSKGVKCPCCEQTVKAYKRSLNSGMTITLYHMFKRYKIHGDDFFHVKNYLRDETLKNNHDWTLLSYWGLIEQKPILSKEPGSKGYWRITAKGIDFVLGRLKVPSYILMYNKQISKPEKNVKSVSFAETLNERFNYEELMKPFKLNKKVQEVLLES